jgi:proteasome lid subunit RPN8/RPN11
MGKLVVAGASPRKLHLSEGAFLSLVTAAVEVYPHETLGILLGTIGESDVMVQHAVSYQTAKRRRNEVEPDPKRSYRVDRFMRTLGHLKRVGSFHSHPETRVLGEDVNHNLSPTDKDSAELNKLEMLVIIDRDNVRRDWRHLTSPRLPLGSLMGSIAPFSLRISGWFVDEFGKQKTFRRCEVHCPFATGLSR